MKKSIDSFLILSVVALIITVVLNGICVYYAYINSLFLLLFYPCCYFALIPCTSSSNVISMKRITENFLTRIVLILITTDAFGVLCLLEMIDKNF